MNQQRIQCIDGWRAIAAMGVLYGHILGALKTPSFTILRVDVIRLFNLWGYGVHLFFVISGFCFFLVLGRNNDNSLNHALKFWKKRWLRIAPAFYVSCLVYALVNYDFIRTFFFRAIFANYLFIQPYVPHAEINAIYWSLSVEWLFYLALPLLFIIIKKTGIYFGISLSILTGLTLNFLHYKGLFWHTSGWQYTFPANFEHFGWGLLAGYLFKNDIVKWQAVNSKAGFVIGLGLAYAGKMFFTEAFVKRAGDWGFFFQSTGPLLMTFGFAWLIMNSLNNPFIFKIIGNKVLVFIGRISYSFYVWHTLVLWLVFTYFRSHFHSTAGGVFLLAISVLAILIPFSYLSYRLLEAFYFKKKNAVASAPLEGAL